MMNAPIQDFFTTEHQKKENSNNVRTGSRPFAPIIRSLLLFCLAVLLFLGSLVVDYYQSQAYAAVSPGPGNACQWYQVRPGDTLSSIAHRMRSNVWTLARANQIANINVIFAYQHLCIPYHMKRYCSAGCRGYSSSGMLSNGTVRWYAYNALEESTQEQVATLLRQAAANYQLPSSLLLAIAWQESGWRQHIISTDGGIGVMQIMPYTAMSLNTATGIHRDPYRLSDNIYLGAHYLHTLWVNFHGDQNKVISAYNEGGWSVVHRGIFNWRYVNNVRYLMHIFR